MQELSRVHVVTLRQVWKDYQSIRRLKPLTLRNYNQRLNYVADWMDIPIDSITRDQIAERHRNLAGDATANGVFRTLRALMHFAAANYADERGEPFIKNNPVRHLTDIGAWRRDRRRSRCLRARQLPVWFKGVYSIESQTARDFLLALLFTGMRSGEMASLQWQQIDLLSGVINLSDTKNGDDATIPMSDFVWNLMIARKFAAKSEYVFPGSQGSEHFRAGTKSYKAVVRACGVEFSPHDLRRTFATVADELDIRPGVIKALLNHRSSDITDSYTVRSVERLRRASQQITNALLAWAGWPRSASLTPTFPAR